MTEKILPKFGHLTQNYEPNNKRSNITVCMMQKQRLKIEVELFVAQSRKELIS